MTVLAWTSWLATRPTGLALVSVKTLRGPRLCTVDDGGALRTVKGASDVARLLGLHDTSSLEEAVDHAGVDPEPVASLLDSSVRLGAPVRPAEVWAAGVTYERSRDARMREAEGHHDVYDSVYVAERPELFLKATGPRVQGPGDPVGLRGDSAWQVPEPELGVVLSRTGGTLGYVLGNDLSSRDIEGANALYLPQAKIFAASCALGPLVLSAATEIDPLKITIGLEIIRDGVTAYQDEVSTARLRRSPHELAEWLTRDNWIAPGTVLLTGTGIVPTDTFSLTAGDEIRIHAEALGTLVNVCEPAAAIPSPAAWAARP